MYSISISSYRYPKSIILYEIRRTTSILQISSVEDKCLGHDIGVGGR